MADSKYPVIKNADLAQWVLYSAQADIALSEYESTWTSFGHVYNTSWASDYNHVDAKQLTYDDMVKLAKKVKPSAPALDAFTDMKDKLKEAYPVLRESRTCPVAECSWCQMHTVVSLLIIHLNDSHEWSREEIATWVDTL